MAVDLETLAAKIEITELETRYEWAVDEGSVEKLADVFAEDARMTLTPGDVDCPDRAAILEWFSGYMNDWGWKNRRHYLTNAQVTVDGDRAGCRAYYLLTYETHGKSRIGWGNYEDRFELRDGRWWITEKQITSAGPVSLDKGWAGLEPLRSPSDWR